MGIARGIQAVERDERRVFPRARVPVAVGGHARIGVDVEVAARRRRQARKVPRVAPRVECHFVTALERGPGQEIHGAGQEDTRLSFVGCRTVNRGDRDLVEPQIDAELTTVMNDVVHHKASQHSHARHREHLIAIRQ